LKNFGSKVVDAALPFSVASLFKKAGQPRGSVVDALNAALALEHFEYAFYQTANSAAGLIPEAYAAGFKTVEAHEKSHVDFFIKAVGDLGGTPVTAATYDFTKGGAYPVFSDYTTFLMTSQAIEDAGLRAHTTLLETVAGHPLFAQVQQIASTEARHAAHSRMIRREQHVNDIPAEFLVNNFAVVNVGRKANHSNNSKHRHFGMA